MKVVGIKYEFKRGSRGVRLVCLKLASIDPDTSRPLGWNFTIKYETNLFLRLQRLWRFNLSLSTFHRTCK